MSSQENACIFCRIGAGQAPAVIRYQNELVVAFDDVSPKAKTHVLVIPKKHIASVDELTPEDEKLVGAMVYAAQKIAREAGIADGGYRLVFNVRAHAGQTVDHIHLHILGGHRLGPLA